MQVIGIRFSNSNKIYYFDPKGIEFALGDSAIVETKRGQEFGAVMTANKEVSEKEIVQPLKKVIRKASISDQEEYDRNVFEAERALEKATQKLQKRDIDMKLISCEYTFDREKLIFSFTAPDRVDFRDFVKELGATFRTRIELRQIHERDDFKMKGALAPCGQECCCARYLDDYVKVSIKMAKTQGLSLNPQNINGMCGKLMCCLNNEYNVYKEAAEVMPKERKSVKTPDGIMGTVVQNDYLRRRVRVKIYENDTVKFKTYDVEELEFNKGGDNPPQPNNKEKNKSNKRINNNNNNDNKSKKTNQIAPKAEVTDKDSE